MQPPLKLFGGKFHFASTIHRLAPPHIMRGIPYGGALGELWNWPYRKISEVVNDIDGRLTNLWHCLRQRDLLEQVKHYLEFTPFGRPFWDEARDHMAYWDANEGTLLKTLDATPDPFWAAQFFILVRQSRGGDQTSFAPLSKSRLRRQINEQASAWWTAIDGLEEVHQRLSAVVVERLLALQFMKKYDSKTTFYYLDPPYMPETRVAKKVYKFEMTYEQHLELLDFLPSLAAKVMISGYAHHEYERALTMKGWHRLEFNVKDCASAAKTKKVKTEVLWMNYQPKAA